MTVHRRGFVCLKADGYIHPDHESRESVLRRHWWALASVVAVRAELAKDCPDVAAGRAQERLVIREGEFTVNHRPMSLRILLAECHCCPDPDPLEPIMHPDPAAAEAIHAASLTALGRLRWFAQNDVGMEQVFTDYDTALAPVLGVEAADVAAATGTEPAPDAASAEFEKLLDASSLGPRPPKEERDEAADAMAHGSAVLALKAIRADDDEQLRELLDGIPWAVFNRIRPMLARLASEMDAAQARRR